MNDFFNRKFLISVVCSLILHIFLFRVFSAQIFDIAIAKPYARQLQVNFGYKKNQYQISKFMSSVYTKEQKPQSSRQSSAITNIDVTHLLVDSENIANKSPSPDIWQSYLPTELTDRKAIPIGNLDVSMFQNVFVSGLPIKLRLFVNNLGVVAKVVELSVLEQDRDFANRLVELLCQITFLPAKKDGLDVDSYQDIEFSFNPILTSSSQIK